MGIFKPTIEQIGAIDWLVNGTGHASIDSVAGSGKSTTLQQALFALLAIKPHLSYLATAFNVHNKNDLAEKGLRAQTLNSVGFQVCRSILADNRVFGNYTVNKDKYKDMLWKAIEAYKRDYNSGFEWTFSEIMDLFTKTRNSLSKFDFDSTWAICEKEGYSFATDDLEELLPILRQVDRRGQKAFLDRGIMDFSDQVIMPCRLGKPSNFPFYEVIAIDEAQDLYPALIQLMLLHQKPQTRFMISFDESQAIMGFTGADSKAVGNLINALNPIRLSLTVSFRCPKAIVPLAQAHVSKFTVPDWAIDGELIYSNPSRTAQELNGGELVICRTNAPLVDLCLSLIAQGKPAKIRGRNFGNAIIGLVKKLEVHAKAEGTKLSQENFLDINNDLKAHELEKARAQGEDKLIAIQDRFESLEALFLSLPKLAKNASIRNALVAQVESIFEDDPDGKKTIMLSSIHRAKGLEAEIVVYWMKRLVPHPMAKTEEAQEQEHNLDYIAVTRTMRKLIIVP